MRQCLWGDGLRLASRSMSAFGVGSEAKIRYVSLNGSAGLDCFGECGFLVSA